MEKVLTIEKLSNSGEGIAREDGFVFFVENALPEDKVKVEITKENTNFAKAKILEILEPAKSRVKPFCPLYNACGSCSLQHVDYEFQLKFKKEIVQDAMRNIANLSVEVDDVVPSPLIKEFRCKIQYPLAQTKVSKRILAGYYKPKSHELTNIKVCPIQPKICDEIVEFLRQKAQELNLTCYDEKTHKGLLRHLVIRHSSLNKENLVTLVVNDDTVFPAIKCLANEIYNNFDSVIGVCVNFNQTHTNLILDKETVLICGKETVEEKILDKIFKIGANTFFQVNPKSAENIFKYVKETIIKKHKNPTLLDAYAGIASFGIVLSDVCEKVVSVEENPNSIILAKDVLEMNNITNVEVLTADTGKFMQTCKSAFDIVLLDPPRKGCDKTTLDEAMRLAKQNIVYVSCNPATLARDLKYLVEKGATIESIRPFDMFCHTTHIENVAIISVNK